MWERHGRIALCCRHRAAQCAGAALLSEVADVTELMMENEGGQERGSDLK